MASLILSCDHAVCAVPEWYRERFRKVEDVLVSPRGWDPGALNLGQAFAMKTHTPLAHGEVTRLLVDLSCDPEDPARFSGFVDAFTEEQRDKLHDRYVVSYVELLRERIRSGLKISPPVHHLSIHTFPRVWEGAMVGTDIGVLFDPTRPAETKLAGRWVTELRASAPELKIDSNAPRGADGDGLISVLHREFPDPDYLVIELEVCQSFFLDGRPWRWDRVKKLLLESFPRE